MSAAATATRQKTGGRKAGTPNKPKAAPPATDAPALAAKFPAYKLVRTDELVPYANNARTHSPEQIAKLVASVRAYGFNNPVLTDGKRGIISGHGRVLAAEVLGMDVLPTIELKHLSAAQKRGYILADNQLATLAGWDNDLLALELGELRDLGFDLALTGFDMPELGRLLGPDAGNTDPDDAPPVQAVAVSRVGDVWILGRHTLHCADCRDVLPTLAGVDAVVTDPPYGIGFEKGAGGKGKHNVRNIAPIAGDDEPFDPSPWLAFPEVIMWGANHYAARLPHGRWMAWDKLAGTPAFDSFSDVEFAWRNGRGKDRLFSHLWKGICKDSEKGGKERWHPTQKPIALMRWCIELLSPESETILDPFAGSGTTIIACEQTGRACVAVEIAPQYTDVAIRRWQSFTGQEAIHEPSGRPFAAIAAERAGEAA
jgi:hypothetical protein